MIQKTFCILFKFAVVSIFIITLARASPFEIGYIDKPFDENRGQWSNQGFDVLPSGTAFEKECCVEVQWGWNEREIALSFTIRDNKSDACDYWCDVFIDTRRRDSSMAGYQPGVSHFVVDGLRSTGRVEIRRVIGAELFSYTPTGSVLSGTPKGKGLRVAVGFGCKSLNGWSPHLGDAIGVGIIVHRRNSKTNQVSYMTNMAMQNPKYKPEQSPIIFDTAVLLDRNSRAISEDCTAKIDEISFDRKSWLDVKIIWGERNTMSAPEAMITCEEHNISVRATAQLSPSKHYYVLHERIPLLESLGKANNARADISIAFETVKASVSVNCNYLAKLIEIEKHVPQQRLESLSEEKRGRLNVLLAAARDAAARLCSVSDGYRPLQIAHRSFFEPGIYDRDIGLFLKMADEIACKPSEATAADFIFGWYSARDGALLPLKVIRPTNYHAGSVYPAKIVIEGSIVGKDFARFLGKDLEIANKAPGLIGEKDFYNIVLYGRGNNLGQWGMEEIEYLMSNLIPRLPIDKSRIGLLGISDGGGDALRLAELYPDYFCWLQTRSGIFQSTPHDVNIDGGGMLDNLRNYRILLESGELDVAVDEGNRKLKDLLCSKGFNCEYKQRNGEYHEFTPSVIPVDYNKLQSTPAHFSYWFNDFNRESLYFLRRIRKMDNAVVANVNCNIQGNVLHVNTLAVDVFSLLISRENETSDISAVSVDGQIISLPLGKRNVVLEYLFKKQDKEWVVLEAPVDTNNAKNDDVLLSDILEGKLVIVFGTIQPVMEDRLKERALTVANKFYGASCKGQLAVGVVDIMPDYAFNDDAKLGQVNVWIVGDSSQNLLAGRLETTVLATRVKLLKNTIESSDLSSDCQYEVITKNIKNEKRRVLFDGGVGDWYLCEPWVDRKNNEVVQYIVDGRLRRH